MAEELELQLHMPKTSVAEEAAAAAPYRTCRLGEPVPLDSCKGVGLEPAQFIGSVCVIATVTLAWIAKRLVDEWLKNRQRGVLFDLRDRPPTISLIEGVPRGKVFVIHASGQQEVLELTYEKSEDLIPTLGRLLSMEGVPT